MERRILTLPRGSAGSAQQCCFKARAKRAIQRAPIFENNMNTCYPKRIQNLLDSLPYDFSELSGHNRLNLYLSFIVRAHFHIHIA